VLRNKDFYCVNIHCNTPLSKYEQDRQYKSRKYRFCRLCRMKIGSGRSQVEWKCIECDKTMSFANRIGQYYCSQRCYEPTRIKKGCKRYRISKLAKAIVEAGGIQNYKCKSSI